MSKNFLLISTLLFGIGMFVNLGKAYGDYSIDECNNNFCYQAQVSRVYTRSDQTFIKLTADTASLNCHLEDGKYILLPKTANYNSMYSLVMASFIHGKKISVYMISSERKCTVKYVYAD